MGRSVEEVLRWLVRVSFPRVILRDLSDRLRVRELAGVGRLLGELKMENKFPCKKLFLLYCPLNPSIHPNAGYYV